VLVAHVESESLNCCIHETANLLEFLEMPEMLVSLLRLDETLSLSPTMDRLIECSLVGTNDVGQKFVLSFWASDDADLKFKLPSMLEQLRLLTGRDAPGVW